MPTSPAVPFLQALFANVPYGYIELRPTKVPSAFLPLPCGDLIGLSDHLARLAAHPTWTPYYGVATRISLGGKAEDCGVVTAVVADVDFKRAGEEAAVEAVGSHPFTPSIVVNTGGGLHALWLLDEPLYDMERAQRLLTAWGATVPLSDAVFDLPRVLRLPGTLNFKYSPARPTELELFDPDRRYAAEDLEAFAAEQQSNQVAHSTGVPLLAARDGELPARFDEGGRHAGLFRLMRSAVAKYNLTFEETLAFIGAVNEQRCDPPLSAHALKAFLRRAYDTPHTSGYQR